VAVISYTLYPDALACEMAREVLEALTWTLQHIQVGSLTGIMGHNISTSVITSVLSSAPAQLIS